MALELFGKSNFGRMVQNGDLDKILEYAKMTPIEGSTTVAYFFMPPFNKGSMFQHVGC